MMKQMNFLYHLLAYLKDYFSGDCVVTDTARIRTTRQYQSRGLRQDSNLSSILFIYLSELLSRLQKLGVGIEQQGGSPVPFFMFADDIVMNLKLYQILWRAGQLVINNYYLLKGGRVMGKGHTLSSPDFKV